MGNRLKDRLKDGLDGRPLTWLADKTGDSYKNVQRWVSGDTTPPPDFLVRYLEATGWSADWLMLGDGPRRKRKAPDAEARIEHALRVLTGED